MLDLGIIVSRSTIIIYLTMHRWIITKYTLIEANKRSFIFLYLAGMLVCLVAAAYTASLSILEKQAVLAAFYGAAVRLMGAAVIGIYILLIETKNLEQGSAFIWLGLPLSRYRYLLEKIFAYMLIGAGLVSITGLPLLWVGLDWMLALQWCVSLYCEMVITISLALLLSVIFKHAMLSISSYAVVYLFARSAAEFYRHSSNIIESGGTVAEILLAWCVKLSTYLVPKLELFASAGWLLHQDNYQIFWFDLILQTIIFSALLISLALAYLRRCEF